MKTLIELKIWIRKGHLSKMFELFQENTIEVQKMKVLKVAKNKELYVMDVLYTDNEKFTQVTDETSTWFKVDSVNNPFLNIVQGGLLELHGKISVENLNDYHTKLVGAYELINHKIAEGEGREFSGIDNAIGLVCGIDCSVEVQDKYLYQLYAGSEIESFLINKTIGYNVYPVMVQYIYPEDLVKTIESIKPSYSLVRINNLDCPELELIEQLQHKNSIPFISREIDEVPLYMLAMLLKIVKQNKLDPENITVGFVGIDLGVKRLARLLKMLQFRRVLGYDVQEKEMLTFEKEGGLATTTENIFGNADIIILIKKEFDHNDFELIRPGQFVISLLDKKMYNLDSLVSQGVRELIYIDSFSVINIVPGLIKGLLLSGCTVIEDSQMVELGRKLVDIIYDNYKFPDMFSGIHSVIENLFEPDNAGT